MMKMRFRMFKNDFFNGISTNLVVMVFILMSAMLSCTSISLIYNSMFQISYFMDDMGHTTELNFFMMNADLIDKNNIEIFLEDQKVSEFQIEEYVNLPNTSMLFNDTQKVNSTGCFASVAPEKYNLVYDEENEQPDIKEGYVGIPLSMKQQLDLSIGDTFHVTRGNQVFTYEIQSFIRDSLYGSEMMGQKRFILHPSDYEKQYEATDFQGHALSVAVASKEHQRDLEVAMQEAGLPNYLMITKDTAQLSFLGISAGSCAIMMMCGVILLFMSFLIIRFTILFQLEKNYTEIGIMKAIGFRQKQIAPIYLGKYIGIAFFATTLGFVISIPFVQYLKETQAGVVPIMPGEMGACISAFIIPIILGMVYGITKLVLRRLKKQSVMDAIRKGNEGESYQSASRLRLTKNKHLSLSTFLAMNDTFTHLRNSIVIVLIYTSALLMILVPLTLKDAFEKDAFLQMLKITSGDLYTPQNGGLNVSTIEEDRKKVEKDLQAYDQDVDVKIETLTGVTLMDQGVNISGFLFKRADNNKGLVFDEGQAPKLKDEIALTSTLAKEFNKSIGDTIDLSWEGKTETFVITGIYTGMMNLGHNVLASDEMEYEYSNSSYLVINFSKDKTTSQELAQQVLKEYQGRALINANDMKRSLSGDVASQITDFSNLIIGMMLFITMAITILFSRLQMMKEQTSIALMQSLGYARKQIRHWQLQRSLFLGVIAILIGCVLHSLFTAKVLGMFFEIIGMGKVTFAHDVINAFVLYPILFILCVLIAQLLVNGTLKKWNINLLNEE